MRKFLRRISVIQEIKQEKPPRRGRGYSTAVRINPYNPLSYIVVLAAVVIGILMFGFYGFWQETDCRNPFKWD